MTEVLRQKLVKLIRGEDGVALVVTLALFMFLYVSCAGIFAISQSVKERITLQNAVDAAAYSAAVVQADTLSRIATINRVMASTYNRMVLRQMDYINDKWLTFANAQYKIVEANSSYIGSEIEGFSGRIKLSNEDFSCSPEEGVVARECDGFVEGDAAAEIVECWRMISLMNETIVAMLYGGDVGPYRYRSLIEEMSRAAEFALEANVPEHIARKCGFKFYVPKIGDWMAKMSEVNDEEMFVKLAENGEDAWGKFKAWFGQEEDKYLRSYTKHELFGQDLRASWHWKDKSGMYQGQINAFASQVKDEFFNGPPEAAEPYVPRLEYFQGLGAVSVAVVWENANPWMRYIKPGEDLSCGLYDVFKPADASEYTLVVSSAQAGYRDRALGEKGTEDFNADNDGNEWRSYVLTEGDVSTYGKTDDWDALYVPVAYALRDGRWSKNIVDGGWTPLGDENDFDVDSVNLRNSKDALLSMHNNRVKRVTLDWDALLELMYH